MPCNLIRQSRNFNNLLNKGSLSSNKLYFCHVCIPHSHSQFLLHSEEISSIFITIYIQDQFVLFISFGRLDASRSTNKLYFQKKLQEKSMLDMAGKLTLYWNQMWRSFISRYFKTTSKLGLRKAFIKTPFSVQLQNAFSTTII